MSTRSRLVVGLVVAVALGALGCSGPPVSTPQQASGSPAASGGGSPTVSSPISPSPPSSLSPSTPGVASPSLPAGSDVSGTVKSGAVERTYLLHLPPEPTRLQPTPIVIAFHGWPMTAETMADVTHLSIVADGHGFAVVFPQGFANSWSVPGGLDTPAHAAGIDDIAFVRSLLDAIGPRYHLDTSRAVVTGISNGGHLAHALGCVLADHLAGIVPVAAPLPIGSASKCKPSRPLSVLEIVGSIDQDASTFPDTLAFWARTDQCPGHLVSSSLPDVAHDGTSVTIASFAGCMGATEV